MIREELLARDFSDVRFFRVHRLATDTYCLQHPNEYCVSGKSMAAHLMGLCWIMDHRRDLATGNEQLRRWLDGSPEIQRPEPPEFRGARTIADVRAAAGPDEYAIAVEQWGRSTWDAYAALHALARAWIERAFAG